MTKDEMYKLLEQKMRQTNWNDKESVHQYNEYARIIRHIYYESKEEEQECTDTYTE